jgi:large subunit ribosomal protein L16
MQIKKNVNKQKTIGRKKDRAKKKIRKTKFKRIHKGRTSIITHSSRTGNLRFGAYGIVILKPTWLDEKKIEAGRKYMRKYLTKKNKIWIRIFPDLPITKKPTGVRMGKGKGKPHVWVSKVSAGTVIFEIDNVSKLKIQQIVNVLKKAWTFSFHLLEMDR